MNRCAAALLAAALAVTASAPLYAKGKAKPKSAKPAVEKAVKPAARKSNSRLAAKTKAWARSWFNVTPVLKESAVGAAAGYTLNTLWMGGGESQEYNMNYHSAGGFSVSVPMRLQIFKWLAFQLECSYIQKNYKWTRDNTQPQYEDFSQSYDNITNSFLDFPMMVNLAVGWPTIGLSVFANIGGYVGYWLTSRRQGRQVSLLPQSYYTSDNPASYGVDGNKDFSDADNRLDGGLLFGAGLRWDIKAFSITAEARYYYGLTDLQARYSPGFIPNVNNTWQFQIGFMVMPWKVHELSRTVRPHSSRTTRRPK
jgi:hypothetical protein